MFRWYACATECYASLYDVYPGSHPTGKNGSHIRYSRWFGRGWTLQELIAPKDVTFFDKRWTKLGTRSSLAEIIAGRTLVDIHLLKAEQLLEFDPGAWKGMEMNISDKRRWLGRYSVAQRMSWAADRQTTRLEDNAYSLLGIFSVSIPLLYGEGRRSFARLQEEIIRSTRSSRPDLSILLWQPTLSNEDSLAGQREDAFESLLAFSPDAFRHCGSIVFQPSPYRFEAITDLTISSNGIRGQIRVLSLYVNDHEEADYAAILDCFVREDVTRAIGLKLVGLNSMTFGQPEDIAATRSLHATPYSASIVHDPRLQRTVLIDALDAEQRYFYTSLFLARECPALNVPEQWLGNLEQPPLPDHIRFHEPSGLILGLSLEIECDLAKVAAPNYPEGSWNRSTLTFKPKNVSDNIVYYPSHALESSRPCVVGSITLRRPDVTLSRVILTVACTLEASSDNYRDKKGGNVVFRIDAIDPANEPSQTDLRLHCEKIASLELPAEDSGWRLPNLFTTHRRSKKRRKDGIKGVQLYEATKVYDGAAFALQPHLHYFAGRPVVILQELNLQSMNELE